MKWPGCDDGLTGCSLGKSKFHCLQHETIGDLFGAIKIIVITYKVQCYSQTAS